MIKKCQCEKEEVGCFMKCPEDENMHCSRDTNHKGKHFACGKTHKLYEWN